MPAKSSMPPKKRNVNENTDFFRLAFLSHPLPMWIYDLETLAFLEVNEATLEKYGYSRAEFLKMTLKDIRPAEDAKKKRPALQRSGEWRHHLKNGRIIDVEINSHAVEFNGRKAALVTAQDVAARKGTDEALHESEKKYRMLFDALPEAVTLLGLDGRIMECNEATAKLAGIPKEELIGRHFTKVGMLDLWEIPKYLKFFSQLLAGKQEDYTEVEVKRGDEHRRLEVFINLVTEGGHFQALQVIARDITERKQAEETLRALSSRQEAILAAVPDILMEVNQDKVYTWANPTGIMFFGEDVIGKEATFYFEGEQEPHDIVESLFRGNENITYVENWQRRKDGEKRLLAWWRHALKNTDGNVVGAVSLAHDITERKQAEEKLTDSEAELRALFASIQDVVLVIDRTGIYRKIAPTNPALLIKPPEELLGKNLRDVFPAEQAETFLVAMRQVLETQQSIRIEYELLIGKHPTWFSASISWMDAENTVWVARNITERKQAEEKIRQMNAELEQRVEERTRELREAQEKLVRQEKLAVMGQLAGGVGHELRNPLAVINNAAYYLKLVQPDADGKIREYLDLIERETRTAEKIITDLLDFSRVTTADREPVSVSDLVHRTLERFPAPAHVDVTLEIPPDLPQVYVDPLQIEQVLGNLTVNACQAMPSGGKLSVISRQSSVKSDALLTDNWILITVQDTGIGIPPENMKKLFEPLFTTKAKGIGLGLAVSRKLAEANGGRIEVQSEAGVGSTFTLYLPVHEEKG